MLRKKHHIAVLLMCLGLLLLGVFLWLFLKKTYEDEAASLQRDTKLLFVGAVRAVENQLFDRLLFNHWESPSDSANTFKVKRPPPIALGDSAKIFTFVHERSISTSEGPLVLKLDSVVEDVKIALRKGAAPQSEGVETSKIISIFVNADSTWAPSRADSARVPMAEALKKNFGEAIAGSGLPVQWEMVSSPDSGEMVAPRATFWAGQYADLATGERIGAIVSSYQWYLWKKIMPQALFSLLLLACVGVAFLLIYQSLRQQMRLTELKNDFIRNMTHELKTPISTVSVAVEALQRFDALDNPARTQEYLDISRQELNRLSLLVDKVLRMSMFEQGAPALKTEVLDFRQLVEEVVAAMRLQFEKYRAEVSLSVSGQDFMLRGDRLHLSSVLYNLLDNALKYSPGQPVISVALDRTSELLRLQVRDNGRGIPDGYQSRVFEKFFRVPSGDVHDVKGHGLGLHYVAGVVQLHQGSIQVASQEGQGTAFTLQFPSTI